MLYKKIFKFNYNYSDYSNITRTFDRYNRYF